MPKPFVLAILFFTVTHGMCCTVIKAATDSNVYIGSNEDWRPFNSQTFVWFTPKSDDRYAVAYFGFAKHRGWAQSAMNEHGLYYDAARMHRSAVGFDSTKASYHGDIFKMVMEECKNLDEAEKLLLGINWYKSASTIRTHFMLADKTGTSAIFEWHDGKLLIYRNHKNFQVMTNFNLADNYKKPPCRRFNRSMKSWRQNPATDKAAFEQLLRTTRQNLSTKTIVEKTYNLTAGTFSITFPQHNDTTFTFQASDCFRDSLHYIQLLPSHKCKLPLKQYSLTGTVYLGKKREPVASRHKAKFFRTVTDTVCATGNYLIMKEYNIAGQLEISATYRTEASLLLNIKDGQGTWYYPNGKIRAQGAYSNGKRNGTWVYFRKDGTVFKRRVYRNGIIAPLKVNNH